jgi:hypothetical protein
MPGRATAPAADAELLSLALLWVLLPVLLLVRVPVLREVDELSPRLAVEVETEVEVDSDVMVVSEAADPEPVAEPEAEPEAEPDRD